VNLPDILIGICLVLSFFLGWKLRAIRLIGILVVVAAGIWMANHFYEQFYEVFPPMAPETSRLLAWFLLFIVTVVTLMLLGSLVLQAAEISGLLWLDHLLGAALTTLVAAVLIAAFLMSMNTLAKPPSWTVQKKSVLAPMLIKTAGPLVDASRKGLPWLQKRLFSTNFPGQSEKPDQAKEPVRAR
jgi:uncharacterized membrane protein required for colicin V production